MDLPQVHRSATVHDDGPAALAREKRVPTHVQAPRAALSTRVPGETDRTSPHRESNVHPSPPQCVQRGSIGNRPPYQLRRESRTAAVRSAPAAATCNRAEPTAFHLQRMCIVPRTVPGGGSCPVHKAPGGQSCSLLNAYDVEAVRAGTRMRRSACCGAPSCGSRHHPVAWRLENGGCIPGWCRKNMTC